MMHTGQDYRLLIIWNNLSHELKMRWNEWVKVITRKDSRYMLKIQYIYVQDSRHMFKIQNICSRFKIHVQDSGCMFKIQNICSRFKLYVQDSKYMFMIQNICSRFRIYVQDSRYMFKIKNINSRLKKYIYRNIYSITGTTLSLHRICTTLPVSWCTTRRISATTRPAMWSGGPGNSPWSRAKVTWLFPEYARNTLRVRWLKKRRTSTQSFHICIFWVSVCCVVERYR